MEKGKKDNHISQVRRILVNQLIDGEFNGSQTDFARAVGKSPQHIHTLVKGVRNIGNSNAHDIETALNKPAGWLSDKNNIDGNYLKIANAQKRFEEIFTTTESDDKQNYGIPLLTSSNVSQHIQSQDKTNGCEYVQSSMAHSNRAFAILMPDESLHAPNASVSFRKGDILTIEPNIHPESGDFVLVLFDKNAIVAQLLIEPDGKYYLKNTNNNEKFALNDNSQIVGIVIEQQRQLLNHNVLEQRLSTR